jgi:membrane protease YdiL (CAAX protease family)
VPGAFDPLLAGAIVATAMASFHAMAFFLPRRASVVAGELILVAIPIGIAALAPPAAGRLAGMRARLGFRLPHPVYLVAGLLIGATAWYLNWRLVSWLEPPGDTRALEEAAERPSLVYALLTLAVLPPICEEILFRGVLARALASQLGMIAAVGITAVLFSAYHLSLVQAGPTFNLGVAFAFLAIRADSVVPTMVAHALNNGIAVTIARNELPGLNLWFGENPTAALVLCAIATASGLALIALRRGSR